MPPTGSSPNNVELGPGWLYVAAIGTAEPTLASAALPSAWRAVGYTEDGSTFTNSMTISPVEVAEEFYPVAQKVTAMAGKVEFQMAEVTRQNLITAVNLGSAVAEPMDGTTVEPPSPDSIVRVMLLWDSLVAPSALNERWLFRQCVFGGDLAIPRKKSPAKSLLPVTASLEKPSGKQPWICFPGPTGLV